MDSTEFCSFNQIEKHVYLGNRRMVCDLQFLEKYNIKRILTLRQNPITKDEKVDGILYKHINVCDLLFEDIVSHFPECYTFISDGQTNGENVYIHCHAGISRSSTVVMAFLMKKYGYSARKSYETVLMKRSCAKPNHGFRYQLSLWEKMMYELNGNNREYRRFLLTTLRNKIETKVLNMSSPEVWNSCLQNYSKAFRHYFRKLSAAEENVNFRGMLYRCTGCTKVLFNEIDVLKSDYTSIACNFVYIEPQKWIFNTIVSKAKSIPDLMSGDIQCNDCNEKLGTFDWQTNDISCKCRLHEELNNYWLFKIFAQKLNN